MFGMREAEPAVQPDETGRRQEPHLLLYEVKVNALLDRAEDPREVLDYSYAQ